MALTEIPSELSSTPSIVDNGNATAITIDASEKIGIGITPATLLDIKESTAATDAIIGLTAGTGGRAQIRSEAQADNTSSELSFHTMSGSNTTEAMRLSGGNLLVGKTSTAFGTAGLRFAPTGAIDATVSGDGSLFLNRLGSDGPVQYFYKDSVNVGKIGCYSGDLTIGNGGTTGLIFEQTGSDRISPWNLTANATRDGEIDLGDSNQRFKDLYLSGVMAAGNGRASTPSVRGTDTNTGLFFPSGGVTAFTQNGVERGRIDASGMLAVPQWHIQTTALGATAYVASGPQGAIYRSTSSIKYKRDVETIEDIYADAVLDVRPVFYRSKSDNDNSAHGFWGIIAEELAEIDPRLVHWQTHVPVEVTDDDGVVTTEMVELDTPEPEGVQYERFVPLLLNLAKRQRDQITAQTAAITDLTTRLTALENN